MKAKKGEKKDKKSCNIMEFVKKNAKIVIPVAIALIMLIIIALVLSNKGGSNGVGNTISNIRNYGYSVSDGKWYYYVSPNDAGTLTEINKIKANGKDDTVLYSTAKTIVSLNEHGDYIYFIEVDTQTYFELEDSLDNKIFRIKKDGSSATPELLNDNDFDNDCLEMYVVNNSIYYSGTDLKIYKMGLDGQNRELVSDTKTGYLGITDKYILYNVKADIEEEYVTYIMDIDGKNQRPVLENKRLYTVGIYDDYVYYTSLDRKIYRIKIDSNQPELLYDVSAFNFNLGDDGYAYYFNYADEKNGDYVVCLFRVKADGSSQTPERLSSLIATSKFLDIVNGKAIYMDKSETESSIKMIDVKEQTSIDLFQFKFPEEEPVEPETTYVDTDEYLNTDVTDATDDTAEDADEE